MLSGTNRIHYTLEKKKINKFLEKDNQYFKWLIENYEEKKHQWFEKAKLKLKQKKEKKKR